jgi:hypothetical protein
MKFFFIQKGFDHNYFIIFDGQHYQVSGVYYFQDGKREFAPRVTGWSKTNLTTEADIVHEYGKELVKRGTKYFPSDIQEEFIRMVFRNWKDY